MMSYPQEILDFWFGKPGEENYGQPRQIWFQPDQTFDEEVRRRFRLDYEAAADGKLAGWEETPEGSLALILLLDQVSNILYRGEAGAFATDAMAREGARKAIEKGFDQQFPSVHRWFFYLPVEHSEDRADQARSVEIYNRLVKHEPTDANWDALHWAVRRQRVIDLLDLSSKAWTGKDRGL